MRTIRTFAGARNGMAGRPASASFTMATNTGSATLEPVWRGPSVRGRSNPI